MYNGFANGVSFFPADHRYVYQGRELSGVTKVIQKRMGKKPFGDYVGEAQREGLHIHHAVESWLDGNTFESVHPGAIWCRDTIADHAKRMGLRVRSEVLVSDFNKYASAIDVVGMTDESEIILYDIKRSFSRVYVTWQISIYKYFIENYAPEPYKVTKCYCLAVRDAKAYELFPYPAKDVKELLYPDMSFSAPAKKNVNGGSHGKSV